MQKHIEPENAICHDNDEISLYDLYQTLVKRKLIIFSVLAATLLAATLYLVIVQPTYEARLRLLLPKLNTLSLSQPEHSYAQFEAKAVFQGFQAQLKLTEQWRLFIVANPELFSSQSEHQSKGFIEEVPVKLRKNKGYPAEHIEISYQNNDAALSANILRNYLQFTRERYVAKLVAQIKSKVEQQKENITADIAMLRQKARLTRDDKIERLRQDLALAKTLGIHGNQLLRSGNAACSGNVIIIATSEIVRGYMRGTKVLAAELDALRKRVSDDLDIDDLREKQIELERMSKLKITSYNFKPYEPDGNIINPQSPIKSKKKLVIAVALILGMMLGIFAAFIAEFIIKARQKVATLKN